MTRFSIGDTWDDARRVLARDGALMLPIAFATFGAAMILFMLSAPPLVVEQGRMPQLPPGPWMFWLIPCTILTLAGMLWISAMVTRPGGTVADAGRLALARAPAAIGVALALLGIQIVLAVPVAVALRIEGGTQPGPLASFLNFLSGAVMFWLSARLIAVLPLLADRGGGALESLRAAYAQTQGQAGKLLLLLLFGLFAGLILVFIFTFLTGALISILIRLTGAAALGSALALICGAAVVSTVLLVWSVTLACAYRRL